MRGDIMGLPVNAVLAPPQAERFASLAGVDPPSGEPRRVTARDGEDLRDTL